MAASAEKQSTIMEHLGELRSRLIICVIALVVALIPCFIFTNDIFQILLIPAPDDFKPVYTELTEMLLTYFKVALAGAVAVTLPVIVYQAIRFVAPGLTKREKRYLVLLMPAVLVFFFGGAAFSYFVLLPFAVKYLLTFSSVADPMIKIGNYISFVTALLFWIGLSFETPLIMYFLARIRVVSAKRFASFRKFAVLGVFAVAAVITPTPDPLNQTIVAVPLYLLFEIGILLARFAR